MREGVISLVYNPAWHDRLPPEVQARVTAAKQQIVAGTLTVPSAEFTPAQPSAS
jgi:hypothetical protein